MRYLLTLTLLIGCSTAWGQSLQKTVAIADTDVSVVIRIVDSTDGTPETGVVYNEFGMDLEYRREGAASVDITEATLASLATAHTDGGFLEIGNGYYRLDVPDAAFATGADSVLIHGTVTDMVVIGCVVQLTPAITVDANGRVDVGSIAGTAQTANDNGADINAILDDTGTSGVRLSVGTGTGQISLSSGGVSLANTNITTVVGSIWNAPIASYSATPNSVAEAVAGIWTDTNAMDTANEWRQFLTGDTAALLDINDIPSDIDARLPTAATKSNLDIAFGSTLAEVTGVPGATDPLWEKIGRLHQALISPYENTTSNGGEKRYKNAAGTVLWEKDLTNDGTTFSESAAGAPD